MDEKQALRAVITAAFLLCACAAALPAGAGTDPLWGKAVELLQANRAWVPGATVFRIELLDGQGRRQDAWETRMRISPGPDGEPVGAVESATHNGKDVTARERENQVRRDAEARRAGRDPFRMGDDPFDPALQGHADVRPLPEARTVEGKACALYAFSVKKPDGTSLEGTAALDSASGAPVEVSYTVKPLPAGVQQLSTVLRYANDPAKGCLLREVSFEGSGGVLFVRKTFRSVVTLDGYWQKAGA
jgi:hypothetical protein